MGLFKNIVKKAGDAIVNVGKKIIAPVAGAALNKLSAGIIPSNILMPPLPKPVASTPVPQVVQYAAQGMSTEKAVIPKITTGLATIMSTKGLQSLQAPKAAENAVMNSFINKEEQKKENVEKFDFKAHWENYKWWYIGGTAGIAVVVLIIWYMKKNKRRY